MYFYYYSALNSTLDFLTAASCLPDLNHPTRKKGETLSGSGQGCGHLCPGHNLGVSSSSELLRSAAGDGKLKLEKQELEMQGPEGTGLLTGKGLKARFQVWLNPEASYCQLVSGANVVHPCPLLHMKPCPTKAMLTQG